MSESKLVARKRLSKGFLPEAGQPSTLLRPMEINNRVRNACDVDPPPKRGRRTNRRPQSRSQWLPGVGELLSNS